MKTPKLEIALNHWPYNLEILPSADGLLVRPRRKARAGWAKAFRNPKAADELVSLRNLPNQFDAKEWEW